MTEDEAKTKSCPTRRYLANESGVIQDKDPPIYWPSNCIGSDCMAWRWDEPWTSQSEEGNGGDITIRLKRKPGEPKLGYCGLAGALR